MPFNLNFLFGGLFTIITISDVAVLLSLSFDSWLIKTIDRTGLQ